jgi:hypothetical protein
MMLLALLVAAAPAAETPKAYMERLYAGYRNSSFNPFDHPERYFAPRLLAAIKEDTRLANGEVGYVDGDPICQCQDPDGLHARVTGVTQQGRDKAIVRVSIGFTGYKARPTTYTLVQTKAGWRIADVSSADEASFLQGIEKSNREMRGKH